MASSFPTSLDAFTNPSSTDAMDSVSVPHATQHSDLNDAVEALEAKVGADSSAVTSSHDYKIADHASRITTLEGASGGGTALITATTFSGASAVSIDNCFTSDYSVYTIQFQATGGGNPLHFRLRSSGTDTTTNYSRGQAIIRYSDGYFSNDGNGTSQTYIALSYPTANGAPRTVTVYQPHESTYTNVWYQGNTESFVIWGGGTHVAASSFDGFTIFPLSATFTGRLEVYGWVKS